MELVPKQRGGDWDLPIVEDLASDELIIGEGGSKQIMQREIIFRGIDLKKKEWVYGYFYKFGEHYYIIEPGKPGIPEQHISVDGNTIGQFTGLLDKNGKMIWEGSILKCPAVDWNLPYGEYLSVVDNRNTPTFYASHVDTGVGEDLLDLVNVGGAIVIGDIYTTPELLEGNK